MAKKVTYKDKEHDVLSSHEFNGRDFHVLKGVGSVLVSQTKPVVEKATKPKAVAEKATKSAPSAQ